MKSLKRALGGYKPVRVTFHARLESVELLDNNSSVQSDRAQEETRTSTLRQGDIMTISFFKSSNRLLASSRPRHIDVSHSRRIEIVIGEQVFFACTLHKSQKTGLFESKQIWVDVTVTRVGYGDPIIVASKSFDLDKYCSGGTETKLIVSGPGCRVIMNISKLGTALDAGVITPQSSPSRTFTAEQPQEIFDAAKITDSSHVKNDQSESNNAPHLASTEMSPHGSPKIKFERKGSGLSPRKISPLRVSPERLFPPFLHQNGFVDAMNEIEKTPAISDNLDDNEATPFLEPNCSRTCKEAQSQGPPDAIMRDISASLGRIDDALSATRDTLRLYVAALPPVQLPSSTSSSSSSSPSYSTLVDAVVNYHNYHQSYSVRRLQRERDNLLRLHTTLSIAHTTQTQDNLAHSQQLLAAAAREREASEATRRSLERLLADRDAEVQKLRHCLELSQQKLSATARRAARHSQAAAQLELQLALTKLTIS